MLVVLLPVAAVLVGGCAYLVVSMAPPRTRVGRWLALWLAIWTEVVLTAEVLSLLDAVTWLGFLVCYVVFGAIVVVIWLRRGKPRVRLLTLPGRGQIVDAARKHPALAVLLVVVAVCAIVNLGLALAVPVNNWDSMTYNLARVGYWIQHGSTDHFFTHNVRQNYMPPNAEFGILSTVIFARAEWPAPLGQYAAYFVCLAAVYATARQTGASNAASLFAALLLGTMTEVILQATIPKNGLVVSSFLACSMAFALTGLRRGPGRDEHRADGPLRLSPLVWSALAAGLAVGTKATALIFLPGLVIAYFVVTITSDARDLLRRGAFLAGCFVCAIVLVGSFNSIRNVRHYGSIAGPAEEADLHLLGKPTPRATISNAARYGYHLCDFSGLIPRGVAHALHEARATVAPVVFRALHIVLNGPELNVYGWREAFPVNAKTGRFDDAVHLDEDRAWFGPIALFVGLPLVLAHLVISPLRRNSARFAVALTPVLYWAGVCAALRYQVWGGRIFVTAAVAGAPLLSLAYLPSLGRALRHVLVWALTVVAFMTATTATFCNSSKALYPKLDAALLKERGRFGLDTTALESVLARHFPEQRRIGILTERDDWEWPLFGRGLSRTLVHLPFDPLYVAEAVRSGEVDLAVIPKRIPLDQLPPVLGERPLLPAADENAEGRLEEAASRAWSFILPPGEASDVFFPTRDWEPSAELRVGASQQFVPTRMLPRGSVRLGIEPGAFAAEGALTFEVFAGDVLVGTIAVAGRGEVHDVVEWPGGGHLLRIEVSATDAALDEELRGRTDVYRLLELPRFEAAQPD